MLSNYINLRQKPNSLHKHSKRDKHLFTQIIVVFSPWVEEKAQHQTHRREDLIIKWVPIMTLIMELSMFIFVEEVKNSAL